MALAAVLAAACASSDPGDATAQRDPDAVVVASFNFDESLLLAEIYAQALEERGVGVQRELALGPREMVQPALLQGFLDLVPEYLGSALAAVAVGGTAPPDDPDAARAALAAVLAPFGVEVLDLAPAQNQNAFVVTRTFALARGLSAVSELEPIAPTLRLGGPAECPDRPYCLPGLRDVYGLDFDRFIVTEGSTRTRRALEEDVVDVGIMFTTDGHLAEPDLVALADDRRLNPVEYIVPLVRRDVLERHGPVLADVLAAVSERLDTEALRFLNWRVSVAGNDPADEARGWLVRQGLIAVP